MTGSLQQKNGRYYAVINLGRIDGKRRQRWISLNMDVKNNKRKAEAALAEILSELRKTTKDPSTDSMFGKYLIKWVERNKSTLQKTTYDGYIYMAVKHIAPYFDSRRITLQSLTVDDLDEYYSSKLTQLSPTSVVKQHCLIHEVLEHAIRRGIISDNVSNRAKKPKRTKYHADFYNEDDLAKLLAVIPGTTIEPVVFLAVYLGLRRSEALGVRWSSIDMDSRTITISEKVVRVHDDDGKIKNEAVSKLKSEASHRTLPLCDVIYDYFERLKSQQERNKAVMGESYSMEYSDYVCVNALGELISPDYVTAAFSKLLRKYHLRHIRFHDLRHSCATVLVRAGCPMKYIQAWLGHADFQTTANTYAHLDMRDKAMLARCLNDALSGVPKTEC